VTAAGARGGSWLTLQTGPWTVHLTLDKAGRLPKARDVIPRPDAAGARLELMPADAEFLAEGPPQRPRDEGDDRELAAGGGTAQDEFRGGLVVCV
jgi:hypothetical protein